MSEKTRVYNDNSYLYEENFNGNLIQIPAKGYIEMEPDQAVLFKGSFGKGIVRTADGGQDPRSFKMIRLENIDDAKPVAEQKKVYVCQADGREFDSKEELDEYITNNHVEKLEDKKLGLKLKNKLKR